MKKTTTTKLRLDRDHIRQLTHVALAHVAGGISGRFCNTTDDEPPSQQNTACAVCYTEAGCH